MAVRITPGVAGVFQIFLDGDKLFDKIEEGGQHPDLPRMKEIRAQLRHRIDSPVPVGGD